MLAGARSFFNSNEFRPSRVGLPPPKHRNSEACKQENDPDADFYPVSDRRDVSLNDLIHRPPVQKVRTEVPDCSLDKAIPQFAVAIDAQIDCDDASDDFIKEKLHSKHPFIKAGRDCGLRFASPDTGSRSIPAAASRFPQGSGKPWLAE
jgi:hypothetical protein